MIARSSAFTLPSPLRSVFSISPKRLASREMASILSRSRTSLAPSGVPEGPVKSGMLSKASSKRSISEVSVKPSPLRSVVYWPAVTSSPASILAFMPSTIDRSTASTTPFPSISEAAAANTSPICIFQPSSVVSAIALNSTKCTPASRYALKEAARMAERSSSALISP